MQRLATIVIALSAAACPGAKTERVTQTSPSPSLAPRSAELARQLESAALESLGQLSLGNLDAYAEGMRSDRPVVLLGARAGDTYVGDARTSPDLDRRPLADLYPQMLSKNLDIQVSKTGAAGWIFDEISVRIPVDGRWASVPIRVTAVFTRDVDRWVLATDHWSYARPTAVVTEAGVAVDELDGDREGSGVKTLVTLVGRLENGDKRALALRSTEPEALLLLPGPEAELRGDRIAGAPTLPELFGTTGTVGLRQHRVEVAPTGDVAWMTATLVLSGADRELLLRASYVFEHGDEGWKVVQEHVSAPVPRDFFDRLLFGGFAASPDSRQSTVDSRQ